MDGCGTAPVTGCPVNGLPGIGRAGDRPIRAAGGPAGDRAIAPAADPVARSSAGRRGTGRAGDRGSVTIEAAVGLAVLSLVLAACLAGIACLLAQLRCADAAREAARLMARGDESGAAQAVSALAPAGAQWSIGGGELVTVTVSAAPAGGLLPGVVISASAAAAREPSGPS